MPPGSPFQIPNSEAVLSEAEENISEIDLQKLICINYARPLRHLKEFSKLHKQCVRKTCTRETNSFFRDGSLKSRKQIKM